MKKIPDYNDKVHKKMIDSGINYHYINSTISDKIKDSINKLTLSAFYHQNKICYINTKSKGRKAGEMDYFYCISDGNVIKIIDKGSQDLYIMFYCHKPEQLNECIPDEEEIDKAIECFKHSKVRVH